MVQQKHVFLIATELGLDAGNTGRDFPIERLPQRIRDLYDECQERMRRLHVGGTVTSELLDGLIRQYELEKKLVATGCPFLVRDDYHWPDVTEAEEDAAWEPPTVDGEEVEGGVAVATKKKSKRR